MIAITPKEDWNWCCAEDAEGPPESRTVWVLGELREQDRVALEDAVMIKQDPVTGAISGGMGTRVYITIRAGLRGIKEGSSFRDEDGKDIQFARSHDGKVADAFLDRIPWRVQQEMYVAIVARLSMTVEEKEE